MALHLVALEKLRTECRQRLESCELWLRRLLHDKLLAEFGSSYVQTATLDGQHIFNKECRGRAETRVAASPAKYQRPIDALLLDDLAAVVSKDDVYKKYFVGAMQSGFPMGPAHLRLILGRLVPIRNALSHANPISTHEAERVLCYSSDVIASIANYYESLGMNQDFNVPTFTRYADSLGNLKHNVDELGSTTGAIVLDFSKSTSLIPGQSLRLEVEVDAHFPPTDYTVTWYAGGSAKSKATGLAYELLLEPSHVGTRFIVNATLVSNKPWHRHGSFDSQLLIAFRVLPPQ